MPLFGLNGQTYSTDNETLSALHSIAPSAMQTGDGSAVQAMIALGCATGRICLYDDPETDGTDFAHPAWWRAEQHTVRELCHQINAILDGSDNGSGISNEPWESTRRRLLALSAPGHPHRAEKENENEFDL